jgi:hypothetical protein
MANPGDNRVPSMNMQSAGSYSQDNCPQDSYPRICFESGLTCEVCTDSTATQLAQVCKGLRGKAIGQLFVQIHPHSACARMHARFAASYREASAGSSKAMGPCSEGPKTMAAVA